MWSAQESQSSLGLASRVRCDGVPVAIGVFFKYSTLPPFNRFQSLILAGYYDVLFYLLFLEEVFLNLL